MDKLSDIKLEDKKRSINFAWPNVNRERLQGDSIIIK